MSEQRESAQPCGCDPGMGHFCAYHDPDTLTQQGVWKNPKDPFKGLPRPVPSPDTFIDVAQPGDTQVKKMITAIRTFDTGATRDQDQTKPDYEGFLSPRVLEAFGRYMTKHRVQSDGSLRASDNWQKGIPRSVYMKSMFRHFVEIWGMHRNGGLYKAGAEQLEESLCALLFNVMGYLYELLEGR